MEFSLSALLSIGLILILGFLIGFLLNKIKIPGLVGMIVVGFIIGPSVLGLISNSVLNISSELRQIALVIILTRSGLNLDLKSLKEIGRPAILMSFLPATFEIIGITIAAYFLLDLKLFESMLLGSVLAAVSPAVVSPRMIKLIEAKKGEKHNVPKLILAGSSVDDIFVIVLFYSFITLVEKNSFSALGMLSIPISIILGILFGIAVGIVLALVLKHTKLSLAMNVLIVFSVTLIMLGIQYLIDSKLADTKFSFIGVSSLLGIIVVGIIILFKVPDKAPELSKGYNNLWLFFEIILFVLVGASLKFNHEIVSNLGFGLLTIFIGLLFRSLGVFLCLIKTNLLYKERLFAILAYLPKATVQASIGGIALSRGLPCGALVLAISVLSIVITAPIGAFMIDHLATTLLTEEEV